jgi:hypothetical protein
MFCLKDVSFANDVPSVGDMPPQIGIGRRVDDEAGEKGHRHRKQQQDLGIHAEPAHERLNSLTHPFVLQSAVTFSTVESKI